MTLRPLEWDVLHPLTGQSLAIIRIVWLVARREPCYRAVTANPEREQRKLVGYWAASTTPTTHASPCTSARSGDPSKAATRTRRRPCRPRSRRPDRTYKSGRRGHNSTPLVHRVRA